MIFQADKKNHFSNSTSLKKSGLRSGFFCTYRQILPYNCRAKVMIRILLAFFIFCCSIIPPSLAQDSKSNLNKFYDSAYVTEQPDMMGLRLYFSKKFTDLIVNVPGQDRRFSFQPNSGRNLGVGFTYQKFSLNLAFPIGFLNKDRYQDWPLFLDLQAHVYPKKMIIDFFGQYYNGFSMDRRFLTESAEDYAREDISLLKLGLNYNYLFNGEKISLAAAFNQSATQKRSAFSPFVGFEVYGGRIKSDSLLLPNNEEVDNLNFNQTNFFQFGPNAGLAGTLVFWKHFFVTAVVSGNLSLGYASYENQSKTDRLGLIPTYFLRGFMGYNGKRYSVNINYVYKNLNLIPNGPFDQALNTGNYRLNFIYKIHPGDKFKAKFQKINPARLFSKD